MSAMNMISQLRQMVRQSGEARITAAEYDQLQAEWITRAALLADAPDVEGPVRRIRALRRAMHEYEGAESSALLTLDVASDALLAQQARIRELEGEIAKLKGQNAAMLHDLETSEGLMCCDNHEGHSLFELKHPSAEAYRRDYPKEGA